jgi:hypothetical protein
MTIVLVAYNRLECQHLQCLFVHLSHHDLNLIAPRLFIFLVLPNTRGARGEVARDGFPTQWSSGKHECERTHEVSSYDRAMKMSNLAMLHRATESMTF